MKSALSDLAVGLAVLCLVLAGFVTGMLGENLRDVVVLSSVIFFIGGFLRGASQTFSSWMNGFLVALGADVAVCIMAVTRFAFTSGPHLSLFIAASLVSAIPGALVREFWGRSNRGASVGLAIGWAAVVLLTAQLLVPTVLERFWTERVDYTAPAFVFTSASRDRITNESLRGRVTVLAFWATWCAPCREELPRLEALYRHYSANPNVAFLAVNSEGDDLATATRKANAFFARMHLSLPLVMSDAATQKTLGVHVLPTLLVIDRSGRVRLVHTGYDGAERLEELVDGQITSLLTQGRS